MNNLDAAIETAVKELIGTDRAKDKVVVSYSASCSPSSSYATSSTSSSTFSASNSTSCSPVVHQAIHKMRQLSKAVWRKK